MFELSSTIAILIIMFILIFLVLLFILIIKGGRNSLWVRGHPIRFPEMCVIEAATEAEVGVTGVQLGPLVKI
ncbi:hypothetical protein K1719_033935 [Acacia pycnantha]|nr:hypothetical protein K1719_033935 [Acacia pycnantha]